MNLLRRTSLLTLLLLVLNIGVFAVQVASGMDAVSPSSGDHLRWGANVAALSFNGDSWRLLSNMFLHGGLVHLMFNMYMLMLWGPFIERYFGRLNFLAIYLVSGLCGSLLSAVWASLPPARFLVSVGASGALMGIAAACFAVRLLHARNMRIPPLLGPSTQTVGLLIAINIVFGLLQPGIDNAAHFGGLLGGAALGALFALAARLPRAWMRAALPIAVLLLALTLLFSGLTSRLSTPELKVMSLQLRAQGY